RPALQLHQCSVRVAATSTLKIIPRSGEFPYDARSAPIIPPPFTPELGARHDRLDQAVESVALGRHAVAHRFDERLIRQDQTAAQRVHKQLTAEILEEVVLAAVGDVSAQPNQAIAFGAVGKCRLGAHGAVSQIAVAALADRAVALKDKPD